jgi:hypothetical protein
VPKAPERLFLKPVDEYELVDSTKPESNALPSAANIIAEQNDSEESLAQAIETNDSSQPARMKYYDDVGYRKTP